MLFNPTVTWLDISGRGGEGAGSGPCSAGVAPFAILSLLDSSSSKLILLSFSGAAFSNRIRFRVSL